MNRLWSADLKNNALRDAFIKFLNCPCRHFPPMEDDSEIMSVYAEAKERGAKEGFIPVIIAYDETLWESLIMNTEAEQESDECKYPFNGEATEIYRAEALKLPLRSCAETLAEICEADVMHEIDRTPDEEIVNAAAEESSIGFSSYWQYSKEMTMPVIIAEIPVKNPWEVFAWIPFGGWNECPDTPQLMSVVKHWSKKYGAIPAVITSDVMEITVPKPVADKKEALALAKEQTAFCSDIVFQGVNSVTALADLLTRSTVWYFWWD